jgi:hypothetical protein
MMIRITLITFWYLMISHNQYHKMIVSNLIVSKIIRKFKEKDLKLIKVVIRIG